MNLKKILDNHRLWLDGKGGKRADLLGADLTGADLTGADLGWTDLTGANLCGANLRGANLRGANLRGANLSGADLSWANLSWANLRGANLSWANLRGANLSGADLSWANLIRADLRETKRGDCTLKDLKADTRRSDGYTFFLWDTEQGWRIEAGCRWFTFAEADEHCKETRSGTRLGDETLTILRFFKARSRQ